MRTASLALLLGASILAAWPLACSSDDTDTGGTTTTTTSSTSTTSTPTGTTTGAGGSGAQGGTEPTCNFSLGEGGNSCEAPGYTPAETDQNVGLVTADVLGLDGEPAALIPGELCGLNICLVAHEADASGHLSLDGQNGAATNALLLYGNGVDYVQLFAALPDVADPALGTIHAARLPALADGVPLVPGEASTSGDVTLTLAAAAFVEFDVLKFCSAGEQAFRAVTIPLDAELVLPAVDPAMSFEMLFGLAPMDTAICPAAQLTVPNLAAWAPDAEVEFWLAGTNLMQEWAPYGGWGKVSDGVVSADGTTVSTNVGEGLPVLGTIAVRLKSAG
jgi:hypothetical protein